MTSLFSSILPGLAALSMLVACGPSVDDGTSQGTGGGSTTQGTGGGDGGSGGVGGAGAGGAGGACIVPSGGLELSLLSGSVCAPDAPQEAVVEGRFAVVDGGFEVVPPAQAPVQILGEIPAIPDGTLVTLSYGCNPGFYGDAGAYVMLENALQIADEANPTEGGSRLWFFSTAGGEAPVPKTFPLPLDYGDGCMDGTIEEGFREPLDLVLSGPGFSATAAPGSEVTFSVPAGAESGAYRAENVAVVFIGYAGGDATSRVNLRITRAVLGT